MTFTDADIERVRNITAQPQDTRQPADSPPRLVARALRRDRLFEAMTERERFESMGVPYDEVRP